LGSTLTVLFVILSSLRHPDLGWNQAEPTWR